MEKLHTLLRDGTPGGARFMMTSERRVPLLLKDLDVLEIKVRNEFYIHVLFLSPYSPKNGIDE